jgi:signal transduction histidine kinase
VGRAIFSVRARLFQTEAFRLAAIYAGLFLGSMALLIVVIYIIVSHAFEANLLKASTDDLAAIRRAYVEGMPANRALHEAKEMVDDRLLASDAEDLFLIEQDGHRIVGNLPVMAPILGTQRLPYGIGPGRVMLGQGITLGPGIYAFVGRDLYTASQAEREVVVAFVLVFCASLILAGGGGLLVSRSFVRRIDAITATCRSIMAGRLNDRIPAKKSRNELDLLADSINAMLDRIGVLMESLRQVSNDIAHDLRTPLAHLRYRLESVRADAGNAADYAVVVDAAIADCDQLLSMFGALLRIAQIEAGARQAGMQELNLDEVLRKVVGLYEPLMDDTGHPFEASFARQEPLRGDPQLLFQLFANLLDNAIRHTPRGSRIRLMSGGISGSAKVIIADEGPGIPEEDRQKVFRRFFRRDQSRTTMGSGLGLSLAAAIADLHGARIELSDNSPGLRAVVNFSTTPTAAARPA